MVILKSWSLTTNHRPPTTNLVPGTSVLLNRRRAVRVEGLDRLEAPRLSLLPLGLGPHDRFPVGREHQPRAGAVELDAVAAGLVDVEEEGLLHGVLVRAGLDVDAVFEADVRRAQHLVLR